MKRSFVVDIVSSLFIILFLYTGISKLLDQDNFRAALLKSPLLIHYQAMICKGIPVLEILVALCLLVPLFKENSALRNGGLIGSFLLMAIFTLYVGFMLKYVPNRPCSCGGIIQQMNWHQHLYFNTIFTLVALLGLILNKKMEASSNHVSLSV